MGQVGNEEAPRKAQPGLTGQKSEPHEKGSIFQEGKKATAVVGAGWDGEWWEAVGK